MFSVLRYVFVTHNLIVEGLELLFSMLNPWLRGKSFHGGRKSRSAVSSQRWKKDYLKEINDFSFFKQFCD